MSKIEKRICQTSIRITGDDVFAISGRALSYNTLSQNLGGFREKLQPGCFTRSLQNPSSDVKCFFNHSDDHILGRQKNRTLQLTDGPAGLDFRCQLDPSNQSHRDLHASIKRGDIDACSFAFNIDGDDGEDRVPDDSQRDCFIRTVRRALLFDVSPVVRPAYSEGTTVSARSFAYRVPSVHSMATDADLRKRATALGLEIREQLRVETLKEQARIEEISKQEHFLNMTPVEQDNFLRAQAYRVGREIAAQ